MTLLVTEGGDSRTVEQIRGHGEEVAGGQPPAGRLDRVPDERVPALAAAVRKAAERISEQFAAIDS
ncbi:hypothetical protein GCM10022251_34020 [Phytohabitans flavus]